MLDVVRLCVLIAGWVFVVVDFKRIWNSLLTADSLGARACFSACFSFSGCQDMGLSFNKNLGIQFIFCQ